MATFSVITACFNNLAIAVSFQRQEGILKRTDGTPLPAASFLGARILHAMLVAVLLVVITAAFGRVLLPCRDSVRVTLLRFILMVLIGSAAFCALGLAATSVIPNADASAAIVNAIILPLEFLSGIFIAFGDTTPTWILWVARGFPIRHFALGTQAGFPGPRSAGRTCSSWGLGGLIIALRFFNWMPTGVGL
jgi:ABC-2 type transport system permease protein